MQRFSPGNEQTFLNYPRARRGKFPNRVRLVTYRESSGIIPSSNASQPAVVSCTMLELSILQRTNSLVCMCATSEIRICTWQASLVARLRFPVPSIAETQLARLKGASPNSRYRVIFAANAAHWLAGNSPESITLSKKLPTWCENYDGSCYSYDLSLTRLFNFCCNFL